MSKLDGIQAECACMTACLMSRTPMRAGRLQDYLNPHSLKVVRAWRAVIGKCRDQWSYQFLNAMAVSAGSQTVEARCAGLQSCCHPQDGWKPA